MSISAVSSSLSTYKSADTSQVERQKANILQQIQQERSSKDNEKTKQAKIAKLEMQLQQLEANIEKVQNNSSDTAASRQVKSDNNILHEYA